ncbi:IKI3 family-domain-containing protein [Globomyces pollinis-pini]|nr:IKI3 family-domain-containing protein [Globomyces pollinis-pini]
MESLVLASQCSKNLNAKAFTINPDTLKLHALTTNDKNIINYNNHSIHGSLLSFFYLVDIQAICLATKEGEITLFHDDGRIEPVGVVDAGILAMEWSPDTELLIIVTEMGTLIEMTRDFQIVTEFPIDVAELGEATAVDLGWGKKETQFHGSAGKKSALTTEQPSELSKDDDFKPKISWRGDGDFFAVSTVSNNPGKRTIRVYNREGVLQNTSEPVNALEHSLSWRPSGNVIASTQRLPHRHQVVFFERNGLRHGEFTIRDDAIIHEIQWNGDSSLLAIRMTFADKTNVIQLWGSSNYYWYLKYEIRAESAPFLNMQWDSESPLRLHLLTEDGKYHNLLFASKVLRSTSLSPLSSATVAVIDGATVNFTPFKFKNVPPPMSYSQYHSDIPIIDLVFGPNPDADEVALLSVDQRIILLQNTSLTTGEIKVSRTFSVKELGGLVRQITWIKPNVILALRYNHELNTDEIIVIDFSTEVISTHAIDLPNEQMNIIEIIYNIDIEISAFQTAAGKVYEIINNDGEYYCIQRAIFGSACPWFACTSIDIGSDDLQVAWIGLTYRNKLYVNDTVIAIDCTSFTIHNEFLILSTLEHVAKFLSLRLSLDNFKLPEKDALTIGFNERSRRIEQGAKIVVATPHHVNLVFQMPRGNLETVSPRALVLSKVRDAVDKKDYRTAFVECRKHRLDLNILIDHNPEQFTQCIGEFVKQIHEVDYLNLIISSLRNEDVTKTMYQPLESSKDEAKDCSDKVNTACDLIRKELESITGKDYNQSILTTDAKKVPPALEDAMTRILDIKVKQSVEAAESSLKYLIFLVDVDKLYDIALGMYDFTLVLMVAQHSHKDPRDYLPFLSELQKLEFNYQRFKIDDHLLKREKAITHLSKCSEAAKYDELLSYMKQHKLYKTGLDLFEVGTEKQLKIVLAFAEYEFEIREFVEAGMLYEMAKDYQNAYESYVLALMHKEAFTMGMILGINKQEIADSLMEGIVMDRRFRDAAQIYIEFLEKPLLGIEQLLKGHFWAEAIMYAHKYNLKHLVEDSIKPALQNYAHVFIEEFDEMFVTFEKQYKRLCKVRIDKEKKRELQLEGGVVDDRLDNIDMFSDTASMATTRVTGTTGRTTYTGLTGMTGRTGKTGRARRKMARKRAAGKDAAFEDEYLIKSLKSMVEKVNLMTDETKSLIRSLMTNMFIADAKAVQRSFKAMMTIIKSHSEEIFVPIKPLISVPPALVNPENIDEEIEELKPAVIIPPVLNASKWWSDAFDGF